jgi:hypothetical protein
MNERIRELALQAGVTGHFAAGTELATPIPLSPEMEKFAELIVAECLNILEDENDGSIDTKSVRLAMIRIKKHFGVEE